MSTRSHGSWPLFLVMAMVVVVASALLSSTRAKPPLVFAAGYGLALGIILRLLADGLNIARRWPMAVLAGLVVGGGFVISFVPSYQKHAAEWEQRRTESPADPIAAAILSQAAENATVPQTPAYSVERYLSQRLPGWSEPWPRIAFGAEWLTAMLLAAAAFVVGLQTTRKPEAPARNDESKVVDVASVSVEDGRLERSPSLSDPLPRSGGERN